MYDIIIPTYGIKGANMVSSLLESISIFNNPSLSNIIISDDGSDIDTLIKLNDTRNAYKNLFNIELIFNERLNSFSKTVNSGMKLSQSSNDILLLNNDMLTLSSFEPFIQFIKNNNKIGIIGAKLLYPNGNVQSVGQVHLKLLNIFRNIHENETSNNTKINLPKKYISVIGACQYINRELINKIGYYDENFSFGYEDTDYCLNAQLNNYEVWYIPYVSMIHYTNKTNKFNAKNRQLFWKKWNNLYHQIQTNQGISDDNIDVKIATASGLVGLYLILK